jgi:hypothetical protein
MSRILSCAVDYTNKYSLEYIREERAKKVNIMPSKAINNWTFEDAMTTTMPHSVPFSMPAKQAKPIPLVLLRPPHIDHENIATKPFTSVNTYAITHEDEVFEDSPDCIQQHYFDSDKPQKLYVLERVKPKINESGKPFPFSHGIFLNYEQTWEGNPIISSMTVTFGRQNGCSNLCSINLPYDFAIKTSTEALFQGRKAAVAGNDMQLKAILEADSGLGSLKAAGREKLPMSPEQISKWNSSSAEMMMLSKLIALGDPAFNTWFELLRAFKDENKIPRVLFLEIGKPDESVWTCGMMGEEIKDKLLVSGGFDELYEKFGTQTKEEGEMKLGNTSGVVVGKLFEIFCEGRDADFEDWGEVCKLDVLYAFNAVTPDTDNDGSGVPSPSKRSRAD